MAAIKPAAPAPMIVMLGWVDGGIAAQRTRRLALPETMIWTTTPWTLPANLAVAVGAKFEYVLARVDGNLTIVAEALLETVAKLGKAEDVHVLGKTTGSALVGLKYRHPFLQYTPKGQGAECEGKCWTIYDAEYVTLEDGTGLVHTAPGHGAEDYDTGKRVGLPIYCPVKGDGTYDESTPEWLRGQHIWKANDAITERLRDSGHLFHSAKFMRSPPLVAAASPSLSARWQPFLVNPY